VVGEVKFRAMGTREKESVRQALAERFRTSRLAAKYPRVCFEVFDTKALDAR
jgi:hypothetical protein